MSIINYPISATTAEVRDRPAQQTGTPWRWRA
jgi:hypothetical protein